MKKLFLPLILVISITSCKKENIEDEITNETNSKPVLSINQPSSKIYSYLGANLNIEGLALDDKGLKSIEVELKSIDANYEFSENYSFKLNDQNYSFSENIKIPLNASIGKYNINAFCIDNENIQSNIITRELSISDSISAKINKLNSNLNIGDLIEIKLIKNQKNIIDSLVIVNKTKNKDIATIKDIGGIKKIEIEQIYMGIFGNPNADITIGEETISNPKVIEIDNTIQNTISYETVLNNNDIRLEIRLWDLNQYSGLSGRFKFEFDN